MTTTTTGDERIADAWCRLSGDELEMLGIVSGRPELQLNSPRLMNWLGKQLRAETRFRDEMKTKRLEGLALETYQPPELEMAYFTALAIETAVSLSPVLHEWATLIRLEVCLEAFARLVEAFTRLEVMHKALTNAKR